MSMKKILLIFSVLLFGDGIYCGFTDPLDAHVDPLLHNFRVPKLSDNSSVSKEPRQSFYQPTTIMSNLGGLRTVMMGGMLYGLSLIPAVVLALGGSGLPLGGVLSSLGLSKRDTSSAKLPLLSESQTRRLLRMLHSAFRQWNVADELCKQLFVCQMYRQVSSNGVSPDLDLFKEALLHILERGGQRRAGRAAEHLLAEYEHYFRAARLGMEQDECEAHYSKCSLSLYPKNDGFRREKSTKKAKTA